MRTSLIFSASLILAFSGPACHRAGSETENGSAYQQAETPYVRKAETGKASEIYANNCATCHGNDMEGGQGPSLIDKIWIHGDDDAEIEKVIREGVPAKAMPAFGTMLDADSINSLIALIREKGSSPPSGKALPLPSGAIRSERATFKVDLISDKVEIPWSLIWLSDKLMLLTERVGHLRTLGTDGTLSAPLKNVPVITDQFIHGGFLGLARDPDYGRNGYIYLAYTDEAVDTLGAAASCKGQGACFDKVSQIKVIRGKIADNALVDQKVIWQAPKSTYRATANFGGRLVFGKDGYLYLSVGDRIYRPDEAQDLRLPNGKIHRFSRDGKVPPDNPFVHMPNAYPTIWSYGHRNPQGLAVDSATGVLWSSEHGPRGGDELNIISRGGNYGWPFVTLGMGYDGRPFDPRFPVGRDAPNAKAMDIRIDPKFNPANTVKPITHWTPSIAVSAITFYQGQNFPGWHGSLLVGSLRAQKMLRLEIRGAHVEKTETLLQGFGDVRDIANGPDGNIYVALNKPGRIIRLSPAR
ncbi:MAG: PQQ-dependent sugar dehydrogenase [Sphingobium sp.]